MTTDNAALTDWLDLAEEVARRHRQGQVLGTDPALVLRGLPPMWRPAASTGGPGDDVVALAGAALERLDPDDATVRPALVEAAAGCLGSDLPALLRQVRPAVGPATVGDPAVTAASVDAEGRRVRPRPGRRLAVAGGLGAVALALAGGLGALGSGPASDRAAPDRPDAAPAGAVDLTAQPTALEGGPGRSVAWQPPHLVVEVDGTRYRYRLEGEIDGISLAGGAPSPTVLVTAGGERWEVAVPALDATGPGRPGS